MTDGRISPVAAVMAGLPVSPEVKDRLSQVLARQDARERAMGMGRTTMRHRLTIYRTHDSTDIQFDFDLPEEPELPTVLKSALKYDMDTPVWAFVVIGDDGGLRGISVPSYQIDHMTLEPFVEATDG